MMETRSTISMRTTIRFLFRSVLLILLFWKLSWNSPKFFDSLHISRSFGQKETKKDLKQAINSHTQELSPIWNKHSVILDSFKAVHYLSKRLTKDSVSDSSLLPPFNAWKEKELTRQEKVEQRDPIQERDKSRSLRRKLNYASAKCGAKILASNKETKYRMAILSEKVDEYMLNPCKAKTWFIVELCDTIEATQIELVNYELYSSSPKKFSTFWSDVYPTQTWHHLGTFEAKDQRVMQSFDLNTKNMGKFIKVAISSHYGTEHYCPLSVFRTLGYSMVYEYEDIELKNEKYNNKKGGTNDSLPGTESPLQLNEKKISSVPDRKLEAKEESEHSLTHESNSRPMAFLLKSCELEQKYCSDSDSPITEKACVNKPSCVFLRQAIPFLGNKSGCKKINNRKSSVSIDFSQTSTPLLNNSDASLDTNLRNLNNFSSSANLSASGAQQNQNFSLSNNNAVGMKTKFNASVVDALSSNTSQEIGYLEFSNPTDQSDLPDIKSNVTENDSPSLQHKRIQKETSVSDDGDECSCRTNAKILEEAGFMINSDDDIESAALIQKESVLIKMTTRIKTAEMNIDLINRYLQQLSKLYRHQMEDMQSMFNGTVKALRIASEKATEIDHRQEISIELLESKMSILNQKVDFLTHGREDIWKRVLELHGFFVIIEIIMISAFISVFMNKLMKKSAFTEKHTVSYLQLFQIL